MKMNCEIRQMRSNEMSDRYDEILKKLRITELSPRVFFFCRQTCRNAEKQNYLSEFEIIIALLSFSIYSCPASML